MAKSVLQTMNDVIERRQAMDFEGAASHYAANATIVLEPGKPVQGRQNVAAGFKALSVAFPSFSIGARTVVEHGDIALHHCAWRAEGPDASGKTVVSAGKTADVLQRQPDGEWLVVIDNPWGTPLLSD